MPLSPQDWGRKAENGGGQGRVGKGGGGQQIRCWAWSGAWCRRSDDIQSQKNPSQDQWNLSLCISIQFQVHKCAYTCMSRPVSVRIDKAFGRNISSFVSSDSQDNKCAADNLDKNLLSASWMDSMTGPKTPSNNLY